MTTAPKRRWFKFSLRTLFVVVTVAAGLAGPALSACKPYLRWLNTLATEICTFRLLLRFIKTGFFGPRVFLR